MNPPPPSPLTGAGDCFPWKIPCGGSWPVSGGLPWAGQCGPRSRAQGIMLVGGKKAQTQSGCGGTGILASLAHPFPSLEPPHPTPTPVVLLLLGCEAIRLLPGPRNAVTSRWCVPGFSKTCDTHARLVLLSG